MWYKDIRFHSSITSSRVSKLWSYGSASGSSSGSWYWAKYGWARAPAAVIRLSVSRTSIFSRRSTALKSCKTMLELQNIYSLQVAGLAPQHNTADILHYLVDWHQWTHQQSSSSAFEAKSWCSSWPAKKTSAVNQMSAPTSSNMSPTFRGDCFVMLLYFDATDSVQCSHRHLIITANFPHSHQ